MWSTLDGARWWEAGIRHHDGAAYGTSPTHNKHQPSRNKVPMMGWRLWPSPLTRIHYLLPSLPPPICPVPANSYRATSLLSSAMQVDRYLLPLPQAGGWAGTGIRSWGELALEFTSVSCVSVTFRSLLQCWAGIHNKPPSLTYMHTGCISPVSVDVSKKLYGTW